MLRKCLILWISYFVACSNAAIVPWIKPCAPLDSPCQLESAELALPHVAKGVKELGIPAIEPLPIKDTNTDTGDLKVKFTNVTLYQLSKCEFKSFTRDPVKSTASVTVHCPTVIKGHYTMSGTMLFLEIVGNGGFTIEGGIMRTAVEMQLKSFTKDGKKHYKVSSFDYVFEPISKYTLNFENLFDGDKEKAMPIEKIMNDAWKELILDIGKDVMREGMTSLMKVVDKVFQVVPAEELETV